MKRFHAQIICLLLFSVATFNPQNTPVATKKVPGQSLTSSYEQFNSVLTENTEKRLHTINVLSSQLKQSLHQDEYTQVSTKLYTELSSLYLFELATDFSSKELAQLQNTMHLMFNFSYLESKKNSPSYPFRYPLLVLLLEAFKSKAISEKKYNADTSYARSLLHINQALLNTKKAPTPDAQKLCKPTYRQMKNLTSCLLYDLESYVPEAPATHTWHDTVGTFSSMILKLSVACAFILPIYTVGHVWYFYRNDIGNMGSNFFNQVSNVATESGEKLDNILNQANNLTTNVNNLTRTLEKTVKKTKF